ncbi:MAG: CRISPR-associated endonuclease Cas2 [Bacteroidales bacterium]|nr:CRISPR-associated endonuclease Cas2 [Bacteroidales bacterium]
MTKKKKKELSFVEKMRLLKRAGMENAKQIESEETTAKESKMLPLEERLQEVLGIYNNQKKHPNRMLYFIMYDIENDKIRTRISKYLEDKGCVRVQKSIFFAQTERSLFNEIHETLREIQDMYQNDDSLFFVPVSTDQMRSMKIVGRSVDFDLIMDNKNTLFF